MPRLTSIELLERAQMNTLGIRVRTNVEKLPELIGQSYAKMAAYLHEQQVLMADVPFVAYYNMDMQDLDVEIGFVVAKQLPAKEDMQPGVIAAGKSAFCMYKGPYQEIEPVYMDMLKWIFDNEYQTTGLVYEHYYNSPNDFPESELLTRIIMPLK